jgi:hypothetical protein
MGMTCSKDNKTKIHPLQTNTDKTNNTILIQSVNTPLSTIYESPPKKKALVKHNLKKINVSLDL